MGTTMDNVGFYPYPQGEHDGCCQPFIIQWECSGVPAPPSMAPPPQLAPPQTHKVLKSRKRQLDVTNAIPRQAAGDGSAWNAMRDGSVY